jgi:RND superfamily putative drug exporter
MLAGLAHIVARHRWKVIGVWVALTLFGVFAGSQVSKRWFQSFSIPGYSGYETNQKTLELFGTGIRPPIVVVFHTSGDATQSTAIEAAMTRAAKAVPPWAPSPPPNPFAFQPRTSSYFSTHNLMYVSKDKHTTFEEIYPPGPATFSTRSGATDILAAAQKGLPAGITVNVTGHDPLEEASSHGGGGGNVFLEAVIGGLGAVVILLFVFGTLPAMLMPVAVAVAAILNTFTLVWALTYITDVSIIVQFLIALVGLGVAIDYALLMIFRFRDELREGQDVETALVETMTHAGRSVIVSGSTVAVGLVSMVILPLPFIRSIGLGGMLIPAVSVLAAITLMPAMLAVLGERINSYRVLPERFIDRGHPEDGAWGRWARFVLRRPWAVAAVGVAIVAVLVTIGVQLNPNEAQLKDFPGTGTAIAGRQMLADAGISPGVMKPFVTLVEETPSSGSSPDAIAREEQKVSGIAGAAVPPGPGWHHGIYTLVEAFPAIDGAAPGIQGVINRVNDTIKGQGATLGGQAPVDRDFVHAVYGNFPYVLAFVLIFTLLLLTRAFRSIVLPIKAAILNLVSLGAAFRDRRVHLPGGPRLVPLEHHGDAGDHGVDPTDDLRVPLRPLDGLRGVHAHAHAGGVRRDGLHRSGDRARPRAHGEARDERGAHPHVRVPRPLVGAGLRDQGVRDRPRGGDHLRRDGDSRAARPGADEAARQRELVPAALGAAGALHSTGAAAGGRSRVVLPTARTSRTKTTTARFGTHISAAARRSVDRTPIPASREPASSWPSGMRQIESRASIEATRASRSGRTSCCIAVSQSVFPTRIEAPKNRPAAMTATNGSGRTSASAGRAVSVQIPNAAATGWRGLIR